VTIEEWNRMARGARLNELLHLYWKECSEDPVDGTPFDMDVIDAINGVRQKYCSEPRESILRASDDPEGEYPTQCIQSCYK
jgi:hypothetical protein